VSAGPLSPAARGARGEEKMDEKILIVDDEKSAIIIIRNASIQKDKCNE
jgi:hypothetical protein